MNENERAQKKRVAFLFSLATTLTIVFVWFSVVARGGFDGFLDRDIEIERTDGALTASLSDDFSDIRDLTGELFDSVRSFRVPFFSSSSTEATTTIEKEIDTSHVEMKIFGESFSTSTTQ